MLQKQSDKAAVIVPFKGRSASPDRRDFVHRLQTCLSVAKQARLRLSILALRLNVEGDNDQAHDEMVDKLLEAIDDQASEHLPCVHLIGRPWRDGLAIIDASAQNSFVMHQKASELVKALQRALGETAEKPSLRFSLGIASYPGDGGDSEMLLGNAYAASERAGNWPMNGFCFFSPHEGKQVASRLAEEGAMLHALRSNMVGVLFQPIISSGKRQVVGAIAEPNWCHHEGALPNIRETTKAELADAYSSWITKAILGPNSHGAKTNNQRISVRAYQAQIASTSLATILRATLHDLEICPKLVDIRFDAALLNDGTDHRLRTGLGQLADLGVQLTAINMDGDLLPLDAITTLPLSAIEFSPVMPLTIGRCAKSEAKLKALVSLVDALGLRTRFIDVASEQQLAFLEYAGCDEVCGPIVTGPVSEA